MSPTARIASRRSSSAAGSTSSAPQNPTIALSCCGLAARKSARALDAANYSFSTSFAASTPSRLAHPATVRHPPSRHLVLITYHHFARPGLTDRASSLFGEVLMMPHGDIVTTRKSGGSIWGRIPPLARVSAVFFDRPADKGSCCIAPYPVQSINNIARTGTKLGAYALTQRLQSAEPALV